MIDFMIYFSIFSFYLFFWLVYLLVAYTFGVGNIKYNMCIFNERYLGNTL